MKEKYYHVIEGSSLEPGGEYELNQHTDYRIRGSLPEGVRIKCHGSLTIDGALDEGATIEAQGDIILNESVPSRCYIHGRSIRGHDIASHNELIATDGDIAVDSIGSHVAMKAPHGNITFGQGIYHVEAHAGNILTFKSVHSHANLQGAEINGGNVGTQSKVKSTQGDVRLGNVGQQCNIIAKKRAHLKGAIDPSVRISQNDQIKVLAAKSLKANGTYSFDEDIIIDGDIPHDVFLNVGGNLTVMGDIHKDCYVTVLGHLAFDKAYKAHLIAESMNGVVAERGNTLTTTKGDMTLDTVKSENKLKSYGDLRIQHVEGVRIETECERGANYAARVLQNANKKRKSLTTEQLGLHIEYDATNKTYFIPYDLIFGPEHADFVHVLDRLQKAGADFPKRAISKDGYEEDGWFITSRKINGENGSGKDDTSKALNELIRRELKNYVKHYKEDIALGR